MLSEYALSHMDECCVVFSKGYSCQSKYQGARYYTQFMRNAAPVENQVEYSFELNAHNKTLLEQIKNAKRRSEAIHKGYRTWGFAREALLWKQRYGKGDGDVLRTLQHGKLSC